MNGGNPKNRLPGHTLRREGYAVDEHGWTTGKREGRAMCSCGQWSPTLPTRAHRQRWHRNHKEAIREAS